jgi:hypothetical protein
LAAVLPLDMESVDLLVLYLLDNGARNAAALATKSATMTMRDFPIIFTNTNCKETPELCTK